MKKAIRTGKVLVDWSQNDEHKTTISVYSLRARERPTVSTPLTWDEVERALKKKDPSLLVFEAPQVLQRVEKMGDLFAPLLKLKQKLPKLDGIGEGKAQEVATRVEIAAHADADADRKKSTARVRTEKKKSTRSR
jgi:bifunctional non-homologous end joining protein LigD